MTNTDELKRLAEAAIQADKTHTGLYPAGVWHVVEYGDDQSRGICVHSGDAWRVCFMATIQSQKDYQQQMAKAEHIAAANPSAILSLIEEVEGLRGEKSELLNGFDKIQTENEWGGREGMTNTDELKRLAEGEMPLIAARKRIYWIVRNKIELLRDTGQTKDADFDNEAWEVISRQLDENARLRAELDKALEVSTKQHDDVGILISMIDSLEEATGEGPEEEDGVIFAQIKRDHDSAISERRAAAAFTERHKSQGESDE